jgi:hypothetical protein
LSNGNMETGSPPTGWTANAPDTVAAAAEERTGGAGSQSLETAWVDGGGGEHAKYEATTAADNGKVFKVTGWAKRTVGTNSCSITFGVNFWPASPRLNLVIAAPTDWTEYTKYATQTTAAAWYVILGQSGGEITARWDDFSVKQVLTPSATGVTIVSTKGGTTYNWAQKDASFNYNDSSGYTYEVYKTNDAPVVAQGSISAGANKMDLTANAFADLNTTFIQADTTLSGVTMNISRVTGYDFITNPSSDLTGYVGQVFKVNDGTGKYLYVKALAAGSGETLGENLISSWTNYVGDAFETFTSSGLDVTQAIETGTGGRAISENLSGGLEGALIKIGGTLTYVSGSGVLRLQPDYKAMALQQILLLITFQLVVHLQHIKPFQYRQEHIQAYIILRGEDTAHWNLTHRDFISNPSPPPLLQV